MGHVTFAQNNESNERTAEKLAETGLIRTATSFHDARPAKSRFADRGRFGTAARHTRQVMVLRSKKEKIMETGK